MKLILINTPTQKYIDGKKPSYRTTAPLGLGYLGTIARNNGVETTLIDGEAEKLTVHEMVLRINAIKPDVIGMNLMSSNYKVALEVLEQVDVPHKIVGGSQATLRCEDYKEKYLVITGEAESIFLEAIKTPRTGIMHGEKIKDLDTLPFIDRTLFCNDPYEYDNKIEATTATSRGCLFECAFCTVPIVNGRSMRARSIKNVIDEIKLLRVQGINSIHFMDDLFNFSRERVEEFCDALIKEDLNISWRALCRIDLLDDNLLEKMKQSGCYKLAFGLESATPRILKYIRKDYDLEQVKHILTTCRELGIQTKGFFTVGYPTESEQEIQDTINFICTVPLTDLCLVAVRAYPGTKLWKDMKKLKFKELTLMDYEHYSHGGRDFKYHIMNTQQLSTVSNEKVDEMIQQAYRRFRQKNESLHCIQTQQHRSRKTQT